MKYDIIIIGSGISGLYAAYNIKKIKFVNTDKRFLIVYIYLKSLLSLYIGIVCDLKVIY